MLLFRSHDRSRSSDRTDDGPELVAGCERHRHQLRLVPEFGDEDDAETEQECVHVAPSGVTLLKGSRRLLPMSQTDQLVAALAAVAGVALLLAVIAQVRLSKVRKDLLLARGRDGEASFVEAVAEHVRQTKQLQSDVEKVQAQLAIAQRDVSAALRHVSVVRFDAFGDMGGRLSFTTALLDDNGDGLLLTSIHGHTESRMYLKTVVNRKVDGRISSEEEEAIAHAKPVSD